MDTVLSERGSLIIYLDKVKYTITPPFCPSVFLYILHFSFSLSHSLSVLHFLSPQVSHTQKEEITFRVHQTLKVGVLQPATVSVYEYYERESQGHLETSAAYINFKFSSFLFADKRYQSR